MPNQSDQNSYFIPVIIAILIILIGFFIIFPYISDKSVQTNSQKKDIVGPTDYDKYVQNLQSGGPPKDGIPPIDNPKYQGVEDAEDFLNEKDVVFILNYKDTVKIYPQKVLVWHEIVNEEIKGEKISVTYCPLTGSTIAYRGHIKKINKETTYGTSGKLLNSNLVMYDRKTDSYIPQILGVGINGDLEGVRLDTFPMLWTTWELAKQKYPNAQVLTDNTGFFRNYNRDPYGSYIESGNYYDSRSVLFPLMNKDSRLREKEVVIGVRGKDAQLAILKNTLRSEKVKNFQVGNEKIVAFYDDSLDAVRIFSRELRGESLSFSLNDNKILDNLGNEWGVEGKSSQGELMWIDSFDVMWFSWVAFFPETELYE